MFFTITNTDDINTNFDLRGDLALNGNVIATGITRCLPTAGTSPTRIVRNFSGISEDIPISLPTSVAVASGDVISVTLYTRIGTNSDDTMCHPPTGAHSNATNLRFYYDSTLSPSELPLTFSPNPPANFYFRSDGTTCSNTITTSDSQNVTTRFLSNAAPTATNPRCKDSGPLDFNKPTLGANPWAIFSTWYLPPIP